MFLPWNKFANFNENVVCQCVINCTILKSIKCFITPIYHPMLNPQSLRLTLICIIHNLKQKYYWLTIYTDHRTWLLGSKILSANNLLRLLYGVHTALCYIVCISHSELTYVLAYTRYTCLNRGGIKAHTIMCRKRVLRLLILSAQAYSGKYTALAKQPFRG